MLFVALLSTRPGSTFQEGGARRLQWDYPEGANVLAEYWLETDSPRVVAIVRHAATQIAMRAASRSGCAPTTRQSR